MCTEILQEHYFEWLGLDESEWGNRTFVACFTDVGSSNASYCASDQGTNLVAQYTESRLFETMYDARLVIANMEYSDS